MRGSGSTGASPTSAAMSSSGRPEPTSASNARARRFQPAKRTARSRITAQDHREASARPSSTPFTTQSALRNMASGEKLAAVSGAASGMSSRDRCPGDKRSGATKLRRDKVKRS